MIALSNIPFSDVLFVFVCFLYFVLAVDFMASLAPPPKRKRGQRGTWIQDEARGEKRKNKE